MNTRDMCTMVDDIFGYYEKARGALVDARNASSEAREHTHGSIGWEALSEEAANFEYEAETHALKVIRLQRMLFDSIGLTPPLDMRKQRHLVEHLDEYEDEFAYDIEHLEEFESVRRYRDEKRNGSKKGNV